MATLTVENYLKATLQIAISDGTDWVTTGKLAQALGVSPGTVTSMLKTLGDSGLAEYRPYEGVSLTDRGRTLALRVLRRHRLIELFLVETLALTWDQVHEEAEHMEHAVSDLVIDRMDDFLGHPEVDPHGDPIPSADGHMRGATPSTQTLAQQPAGSAIRLDRVTNQHPEFLRFLAEAGLSIGVVGTVVSNQAASGIVTLQLVPPPESDGAPPLTVSLGLPAAAHLRVSVIKRPVA